MYKTAIVPGSFDPVTIGHEDIVLRAAEMFDEVVVAVCNNSQKQYCFDIDERLYLCQKAFEGKKGIRVVKCEKLVTQFCREYNISVLVKGIRNVQDYDYEFELAMIHRQMGGLETVFLPCRNELSHISSKMVREFGRYRSDISGLVPVQIRQYVSKKFGIKE